MSSLTESLRFLDHKFSASTARRARRHRPAVSGPRIPRTTHPGTRWQRCRRHRPFAPFPSTMQSELARAVLVLLFLAAVPRGGDGALTSNGASHPVARDESRGTSPAGGTYELMVALRKERRAARGDVRKALFHENAEPVRPISLDGPAHSPAAGAPGASPQRSVSRGREHATGSHGVAGPVSVLSPLYPPGAVPAGAPSHVFSQFSSLPLFYTLYHLICHYLCIVPFTRILTF